MHERKKGKKRVGGLTVGDLGVAPQGGLIAGGDAKNSRVPLEIFHAILDSVVVRYVALQPTVDDVGGDSKARDSARPDVLVRGLPLAGHDVVGAGLVAPGVLPKVDSRGKGQNWILGDPVGVLQEVKVSPPRIEGSHGLAGGRVVVVPAQLHRPSPVIRLSIDQSKPAKIAKICQNS